MYNLYKITSLKGEQFEASTLCLESRKIRYINDKVEQLFTGLPSKKAFSLAHTLNTTTL